MGFQDPDHARAPGPNPTWIISDAAATDELLATVDEASSDVAGIPGQRYDGFGYREFKVSAIGDDEESWCGSLPARENPRRHMALVVWPGWDYHWYREQQGGFWGHRPGSAAARNYDNSNKSITDPETCYRGGYTNNCGYFYAGRSVVIN
ncbi:hypothetical protein [Streptomyces sp. NPDC001530]|uniref:hypothetical protein n=1 Tax=Streptomyces sp. NPDC001530 TaxID=3364582 RepID=UPI0036CD929E